MDMQSADYELYKAEFERCPWDRDFRQTKDEFVEAPSADDLNHFLGKIDG